MEITGKTRVYDILKEYGDIAEVMEIFGVRRVGGFGFRKFLARFISIKTAARVHRVPLKNFIGMVETAINTKGE
jgi:hypothetical protein